MVSGFRWVSIAVGLTAVVASATAHAAPVEFNFDLIPSAAFLSSQSLSLGQGATASSTSIQMYMNGVLGCASCVTVTGAIANSGYTGDGRVVKTSGGLFKTLANFNDTTAPGSFPAGSFPTGFISPKHVFLMNNNFGLWSGVDTPSTVSPNSFTITFQRPIASLGFDWEIFPEGACQGGLNTTTCKTLPSITLQTNGGVVLFSQLADTALSTNPQGVGGLVTVNFPSGKNQITFLDWPSEIGVRGLEVTFRAPEPGSLALIGAALAGIGLVALRRRKLNG